MKKFEEVYNINSVFYSTTIKDFTILTKQSNKMFVLNEIVSKIFELKCRFFNYNKN